MDSTHLHLLLNHFPILGSLFGTGLLAYGLIRKHETLAKAGLVTFIFIALITIPVFLTGEPAEETIEHLPGVSEILIEKHEEAAEVALWVMELLGLTSLITFAVMYKKRSSQKIFQYVTLLMALFVFGLMARVGNLGGEIRHTEIRKDFNQGQDSKSQEYKGEEQDED